MGKANWGGIGPNQWQRVGQALDQLLESFEQLEAGLEHVFAQWQKKLEELATPQKGEMENASNGGVPRGSNPSDFSQTNLSNLAPAQALQPANFSESLPPPAETWPSLPERLPDGPGSPKDAPPNLLAAYMVEQLEQLQHQRDQLQAQCTQLQVQLAEKTQQVAHLTTLLEQHQRQLLHYQQHWMEHLQLLKPLLDSLFSTLTELPYDGGAPLAGGERTESALAQAHQILPLSALRDRKSSIG